MINAPGYTAAIKSIWLDRCTVKVKTDETTANGRTVQTNTVLFADEPCRLSHNSVTTPDEISHAAIKVQGTVLYIDKDKTIPAGSTITVTHEDVTREYELSGVPAVYSVHQEIPLRLKKEWS